MEKIQNLKNKTYVSIVLKAKRFMRVLRRPFLRIKGNYTMDIYKNQSNQDPLMTSNQKLDSDIKLFDIACALAALCALLSVFKSIFGFFR